jgi:hypothetical protein
VTRRALLGCLLIASRTYAQDPADPHQGHHMEGMTHDHAGMAGRHHMGSNEAGQFLMEQASGTSMNPKSWTMPMIGARTGSWNWMFMGQAYLVDTQQSGPRGGDKLYAPNWFMIASEHAVGKGSFLFQFMGSLDPATVTSRRYPLLFQTGETAFGKPLVDAQHPHDLIMGLGIHYARPLSEKTLFQLYFAPVGDPALGPVAFPHRASAAELPQATLGHHWQDSSHIANEVITAGISHGVFRLEASGFHGQEPNENRWNIDHGAIDSWSSRLSVSPSKNWTGQVSIGRLRHPEPLEGGDIVRSTASLHYTRPLAGGGAWSSSFIWGRNHKTDAGRNTNSYTVESVVPLGRRNFITGRAELVDKDELFATQPEIKERLERTAGDSFRIGAYTVGYTRNVEMLRFVETGVGGNFTLYTLSAAVQPYYGSHPLGANFYIRFRLRPGE